MSLPGWLLQSLYCVHIIWNVFLLEKSDVEGDDFSTMITDEHIGHVIGIIKADFVEDFRRKCNDVNVSHTTLVYKGNTTDIDWDQYDGMCELIEDKRAARSNVAVFCSSGYQRSLPLLCYYMMKTHASEVPTVDRAIDIILPQVDKHSYATSRAEYVSIVSDLISHKLIP